MFIKNAVIINEKMFRGSVEIENGKIKRILKDVYPEGPGFDAMGRFLSPGFIDIHIHGIAGFDSMDDSYEAINNMSLSLLKHGVTTFLPTTKTSKLNDIKNAVENISKCIEMGVDGAQIAGINLEGPFISPEMAGNHDIDLILDPSICDFEYITGKRLKYIKILTIAPEVYGAIDFIRFASKLKITLSAGHTAGTYDDFMKGVNAGITHSTHLYNGMRSFSGKEPSAIGAVFDSNITSEIVPDGILTHFAAVKMAIKIIGVNKLALISNSIRACDMKDGIYNLSKRAFSKGSMLTIDKAIYNIIMYCNLPLYAAIEMATSTPAKILGLDKNKGYIKEGYDADLVILDDKMNIYDVFVGGVKK